MYDVRVREDEKKHRRKGGWRRIYTEDILYAYVHASSSDATDGCGESERGFRTGESTELLKLNSSCCFSSSSLSSSIRSTDICLDPRRGGGESEVIP